MVSQQEKGARFKSLHERKSIFMLPNPWDAGSARILTGLGFEAMATTSAGLAFLLGKTDGTGSVTREEALENARMICAVTDLPVSADLENGYGDSPSDCAETILMAAETGLAGGSVEDATGKESDPIYPFELSVARIRAASQAAKSLSFPFTLTARAENLIYGRPDLDDTIRRLIAYAEAGADVLFAPGLKTRSEIETVVKAVAPKPVNVIAGIGEAAFSLAQFESFGVKRISTGSSLSRAAYGNFYSAAKEIRDHGTFSYATDSISYARINQLMNA